MDEPGIMLYEAAVLWFDSDEAQEALLWRVLGFEGLGGAEKLCLEANIVECAK